MAFNVELLKEMAETFKKMEGLREMLWRQYVADLKQRLKIHEIHDPLIRKDLLVCAARKELSPNEIYGSTDFYGVAWVILEVGSRSVAAHVADSIVQMAERKAKES